MAITYGIDKVTNTSRCTGYTAYFDSALYNVGTYNNKRLISEIEFQLAKPLATGQGIKLQYRRNLSDSFTLIGTFDYSTLGSVLSYVYPLPVPLDCEFIQVRCYLTTGAASNTSPELRNIILR